jgi:hypothetical protein
MTVTIELSDEQLAALKSQAAAEGLSVEAWLQRLAEQYAQSRLAPKPQFVDRPTWQIVLDAFKDVPEEVWERMPTDGASEHDHYFYGWPKRNH